MIVFKLTAFYSETHKPPLSASEKMDNKVIISLFDPKLTQNANAEKAFKFICENYFISEDKRDRLQKKLYNTAYKYKLKWNEAHRKTERFEFNNQDWINGDFGIAEFIEEAQDVKPSTSASSAKHGRPSKSFADLSERGKRRVIDDEGVDPKVDSVEKALLLARRTAYNRREVNLVKVIGHILRNQGDSKRMYTQLTDQRGLMSPEEAFSFFIEAGLSRFQYELMHSESPSRFPPYGVIREVKKKCAPPIEFFEATSSKIRVKLQALLDNTVHRIVKVIDAELNNYMDSEKLDSAELILLCSWGMDGSTGYSQYHQQLPEGFQDDSDVFSSTLTPIQLFMSNDRKKVMWFNAMPQSIRFCRPIMLEFIKESKELILATKNDIEKEIFELTPVKVELVNDRIILVDFDFVLSMIDGKVLTYITGNSSMQNCPICGAKPNAMNSKDKFKEGFISNKDALNYGISPLHAWIRFFECLLHISYRMDFKKWQVSQPFKEQYEQRKKLIKNRLHEHFGVRVDQPRSGGSGTSTTGNVCRRTLANPQLLSRTLNIDEELIVRFRNILIAINCQEPINPEKLDSYCNDTYRLYLKLYDWYKIPATVHKILAHAGEIIMHSPAPLGILAEEAAESQHKQLKKYRTHHARKRSRLDNLHDVFMRAMNESDPFISSLWMKRRRQKKIVLEYPDIVKSFMIFEDSGTRSTSETDNCDALEELMKAVDEVDEDFLCDELESE